MNRQLLADGAANVPSVVIVWIVDPAWVYTVADASLSAIVEIIRPALALVSPVSPAPVELLRRSVRMMAMR